MVIGIDGACRRNGFASARASSGIYFDANSSFNSHAPLQDTSRQTNQLAEIIAATRALNKVETMLSPHCLTDHIILITDSSYLALGMSKHVYQWQKRQWRDATGQEIVNRRAFQVLHGIIHRMEEDGVSVQFWLVPREENTEADTLANAALDQEEVRMAKTISEFAKEMSKEHATGGLLERAQQGDEMASDEIRRRMEHTLSRPHFSAEQLESFRRQLDLANRSSQTGQRNSTGRRVPPNQSSRGGRSFNV